MTGTLLGKLQSLGLKAQVLSEIGDQKSAGEEVIEVVTLHMKRSIVFTSLRLISICSIPLVGRNTEWKRSKIVVMGGNFQIPYATISEIRRAETRIRTPITVQNDIFTRMAKAVLPAISRGIWPYELQLIDASENVMERIYGVTEDQASMVRGVAIKLGIKFTARDSI